MEWKFKADAEPVVSNDFWYDLTDGGYIKPEELLDDEEQIKELKEAIELIQNFGNALEEAGLLEEY